MAEEKLLVKRDGDFCYPIYFENDFQALSGALKEEGLAGKKMCIVSDSTVAPLNAEQVKAELQKITDHVCQFVFPAGEAHKNLDIVEDLYQCLIENGLDRKSLVVALGGGVTGDLSGFGAATYLRGSDFIQIPTTLLAQVDSSVGGKTGVDFAQYKNMVGAFHQPRLVYMNLNTLKTLPEDQFASGMGEVLKSGLIRDARFYEWTINHMSEIQERIYPVLVKMVRKCCEIKAAVVESDPTEQGERALLNLGHTVGHAVEKLKNFELLHGQCVALGTIAAAYISFKRGCLSTEEFYEIRDMNVGFDLPIFFNGLDNEAVLQTTKSDKKMDNGKIKFILLKKIGQAYIDKTVTDEEILDAIQFINGDMIEGE